MFTIDSEGLLLLVELERFSRTGGDKGGWPFSSPIGNPLLSVLMFAAD